VQTTILSLAAAAMIAVGAAAAGGPAAHTDALVVAEILETPPAAWAPQDSADSLYRAGRDALNRGDHELAARLFGDIVARFPRSQYAGDALYWRAFALYRRGGREGLQEALAALRRQAEAYPKAATRRDGEVLRVRIDGELARGGDAAAAESVAEAARAVAEESREDAADGGDAADRQARGGAQCADEDADMRIAALNALQQMDEEQALPILRDVLAKRGPCTEVLRRKAVFLVAQTEREEAGAILLGAIRGDPDPEVRRQAVFWLSEIPGEGTVATLDSLLRASTDREMWERAIFALSEHDSPRAGRILRDLAEREGTDPERRARAIFALGHHRGTAEDAAFLRALYPRLGDEELKEQVIQSVAQVEGSDVAAWLEGIVNNANESLELRKKALFWRADMGDATSLLIRFYEQSRDREMREQAIWLLSDQKSSTALDKLIAIARTEPDVELRKKAIFWLGQSDDPRVKRLLVEIINTPNEE
jgi:HEAT repeat protein